IRALQVWKHTLVLGGRDLFAVAAAGDGRHDLWRHHIPRGEVHALRVRGVTLYVGGEFAQVDGQARQDLAAGALHRARAPRAFAPAVPISLWALAFAGDDLVFGGRARDQTEVLGAVDSSGAVEEWRVDDAGLAGAGNHFDVRALASIPGGVLVGGSSWPGSD